MNQFTPLILGVAAGIAAWWYNSQAKAQALDAASVDGTTDRAPGVLDQASNFIQQGIEAIMPFNISKNLPQNAAYVEALRAAEQKYGIPPELLVAQAYQESRFNPAAVNAYSGAQGMMQFMPATASSFGIDPFDPAQAIDAAGKYMAQLYRSTGDWKLALAAYNWGIGNLNRKGIAAAPTETRNYMAQISSNAGYA